MFSFLYSNELNTIRSKSNIVDEFCSGVYQYICNFTMKIIIPKIIPTLNKSNQNDHMNVFLLPTLSSLENEELDKV